MIQTLTQHKYQQYDTHNLHSRKNLKVNGRICGKQLEGPEKTSTILTLIHIHLISMSMWYNSPKRFIYLPFINSSFHSSSLSQFPTSFNSKRILNSLSSSPVHHLNSTLRYHFKKSIDWRARSSSIFPLFTIADHLILYRQYPYPKTLILWGTKIPFLCVSKQM